MTNLPSGTVTFLFTDIEGSTILWENHPEDIKFAKELGEYEKETAVLRDMLGDLSCKKHWTEGGTLTMHEAIQLALNEST